jgi:hypothetical protein
MRLAMKHLRPLTPILCAALLVLPLAVPGAAPVSGGGSTLTLEGGASSKEALIERFLQALREKDRVALRALRLSEAEYREIVLPGHVAVGEPLREYTEDTSKFAWDTLNGKSAYWEIALLNQFGGRTFEITSVDYEEGVDAFATYTAYRQLRLTLQEAAGPRVELRTGSIAEIGGQFKFVSYIRD